jgi:hemolysin III
VDRPFIVRFNKDPWSWITHFAGLIAAVVGTAYLVQWSADDTAKIAAMVAFGGSLALVFLASSIYHFFDLGERGNLELQRIDHIAIFVLIGGSYVPAVVHLMSGPHRIVVLAVIGVLCLMGIVFKVLWMGAPQWLSVSIYLGIAWLALIPMWEIAPHLTAWSGSCLAVGGSAYTIGAFIFAGEWPDPWPDVFGHHEIWHVFVLFGGLCHWLFAAWLLDVPVPAF